MSQLGLYKFDVKEWKKVEENKTEITFKKISIMTYNTLFDKYNSEIIYSKERWKVQLREFSNLKPKILVLQEVRKDYLSVLLNNSFIQENYLINSLDEWLFENHTVITLIHKDITVKSSSYIKYTHEEASHTIGIVNEVILNGKDPLGIVGVHFRHSPHRVKIRKQQLEDIYALCIENQWKDFIILGDFNFEHKEDVKSIREKISYDVWPELKFNEMATYDSYKNYLVRGVIRCRLDRIVFSRKSKQAYKVTNIDLVMNKPFSETDPDVQVPDSKFFYPSDHFGLIAEIEPNENE